MVNEDKQAKVQALLEELDPEDVMIFLQALKQKKETGAEEEFDSPIKTTGGSAIKKKERPNHFLSMKFNRKEKEELKKDKELDAKLLKDVELTPRERASSTIEVSCSVCGKKEWVNRSIVLSPTRYRCNNCCIGGRNG